LEANGDTVGTVLSTLIAQHPALKSHLFQDGQLQRYVNVYLNNQDIQYLEKLDTPVKGDDTIIILPAMAGG
jgi:molybdopterin converting factor small subunit